MDQKWLSAEPKRLEKQMKTLSLLTGIAAALVAITAQAAYDGTISIGARPTGYGSGPGGAFDVTVLSGLGQLNSGNFLTFCIEKNEYITVPGSPYDVDLGPSSVKGGLGGPQPDPISIGTAWLYSQFRKGTLANYTYGNNTSANQLQDAIWWLEGEMADPGAGNVFRQDILAKYGANATLDSGGAFGVVVMNLFNGPANSGAPDYLNQSLLAVVPEPSTVIAGVLLLLPFGASAVRILRKKS